MEKVKFFSPWQLPIAMSFTKFPLFFTEGKQRLSAQSISITRRRCSFLKGVLALSGPVYCSGFQLLPSKLFQMRRTQLGSSCVCKTRICSAVYIFLAERLVIVPLGVCTHEYEHTHAYLDFCSELLLLKLGFFPFSLVAVLEMSVLQ